MAGPYQKFLRQKLDLSALELFSREESYPYFCTPRGAKIIGWAGVDGIHFCFVRGFGEMVFAVSPMNLPGEYVHPVARDFLDFLRMLLACGGTAALEQGWQWSEKAFHEFIWDQLPSAETQKTMDLVEETFQILPMEQPYQYLKALQSEFDYSRLRFTEDYYDPEMGGTPAHSEWKVYFESGFYSHHGRDKAGSELDIGREFEWKGRYFYVPALYLCSKGLVLDICRRIDTKSSDEACFDEEALSGNRRLQMLQQAQSPFAPNFIPCAIANGKRLEISTCSTICWDPGKSESVPPDVMSHYKLDLNSRWEICRWSFPWVTQRKPQLHSLLLTLTEDPDYLPGEAFCLQKPGDSVCFSDPYTDQEYTLTALILEPRNFGNEFFGSEEKVYPPYLVQLSYTIEPEPAPHTFQLLDCAVSDQPRQNQAVQKETAADEQSDAAAAIALIGGADGPTAFMVMPMPSGEDHVEFSSSHFEPVDKVYWFPAFRKEKPDSFTAELL